MIETKGQSEKFQGSSPSVSPTALGFGVFSLCSGGLPSKGSFGKLQGKTLKSTGALTGGILSIYAFGEKLVVQSFVGIEIINLRDFIPHLADYVYDNEGNLVYDKSGLPITQ